MTNEERLKASKDQIYTYVSRQYTKWHVAAVKSIKKILLNLNDFYCDILTEITSEGEKNVLQSIKNGWFYEAIAHAEQAIEDLFSLLMCLDDPSFFTKDVLFYNAGNAKKYIWDFNFEDLKHVCDEFGYTYFPFDEFWEHEDVFEEYKKGVLLTQNYVRGLKAFHQKYYDDYCQYKHGLSVGLKPMGNVRDDRMLEGALFTFHNGTIGDYEKRNRELPAPMIMLKPGTQHHIRALHDEGNLLFQTVHAVDINEVEQVTTHACILLDVVWHNIIEACKDDDEFHEVAFPLDELNKCFVVGFPRGRE